MSTVDPQMRAPALTWQGNPAPTRKMAVAYRRTQDVAVGLLVIIMGGLIAIILLGPLTPATLISAALIALVLAAVVFLRVRAARRGVRLFDAEGVTRRDGRLFRWNSFGGVVHRTRRLASGKTFVWRFEITFTDGEDAWIIPQQIKNFEEVLAYVASLPKAPDKAAA